MSNMPVFVIKAKDELSLEAIRFYGELCAKKGLDEQAKQVAAALDEFEGWQLDYPGIVKLPDHKHVPVNRQVDDLTDLDDDGPYQLRIKRSILVEVVQPITDQSYPDMTPAQAQQYELDLDRETHVESIVESLAFVEPSQHEDDRATEERSVAFLRVEVTVEAA